MRGEKDVVGEDVGLFLVLSQSFSQIRTSASPAAQIVLYRLAGISVSEFHIQNHAGVVLAHGFGIISSAAGSGASRRALNKGVLCPVHFVKGLIDLDQNRRQIVRFTVLIFAQNKDAITVAYSGELLFARELHTALRLSVEGNGVVTELMFRTRAAKNDRRRPHFADDNPLFLAGLLSSP